MFNIMGIVVFFLTVVIKYNVQHPSDCFNYMAATNQIEQSSVRNYAVS